MSNNNFIHMNTRMLIGGGVALVVIAGVAGFTGGMRYQSSSRQVFGGERGLQQGMMQGRRSGPNNAGLVAGTVLSRDASMMTIQLPNGGSSIVIGSTATSVEKAASGSWNDIQVGSPVVVRGTQKDDGSFVAQSVQISRMPMRPLTSGLPVQK